MAREEAKHVSRLANSFSACAPTAKRNRSSGNVPTLSRLSSGWVAMETGGNKKTVFLEAGESRGERL